MYIQQLYTNCLSEAAYFIESEGEVAIIDPLRDIDIYIKMASEKNAKIKYIFETHFHADFVSGHIDLAEKTGAQIIYGPDAKTSFSKHMAKDGEEFTLGKCTFRVLHTPGHTLESSCYLLLDEHGVPNSLFSGDTLFVGDVGRPDLFSGNLSSEELAEQMYHSLEKIKRLPDYVKVYPAHGPGSSCGKNLGPETFSTIGAQKQTNYALQPQTKDEFVKVVTTGLNPPPAYFPINAKINKEGYDSLDIVLMQSKQALPVAAFKNKITEDTIILDTRKAEVFTQGFIPKSIFIGLESRFAEWVGTLIPFDKPILLVTEESQLDETLIRLSRVGYDNVIGYLNGGFAAWQNAGEEIDLIIDVDADELAMDLKFDDNIVIMDVRKEGEFNTGHLVGAKNSPLQEFTNLLAIASIDEQDNVYVHCAGGYRSVIACSLIKKEGVHNIRNIVGGWSKIKDVAELEIVLPSTTLN